MKYLVVLRLERDYDLKLLHLSFQSKSKAIFHGIIDAEYKLAEKPVVLPFPEQFKKGVQP